MEQKDVLLGHMEDLADKAIKTGCAASRFLTLAEQREFGSSTVFAARERIERRRLAVGTRIGPRQIAGGRRSIVERPDIRAGRALRAVNRCVILG